MKIQKRLVLVPLYFFLGGLAGGCFVLAALAYFVSGSAGHPLVLRGFALAFPLILLSAVILTVDLTQPLRFWRLFTRFKPISPVSMGSWALAGFGLVAAAAWSKIFIAALGPYLPSSWVEVLGGLPLSQLAWIGLPLALFVASYTGVLLNTSARPLWSSQPLLGGLFFASALATAVAVLTLWAESDHALTDETLTKLLAVEELLLTAQLILTVGFLVLAKRRLGWHDPKLRELLRGRLSLLFHGSWLTGLVLPLAAWSVASPGRRLIEIGLIGVLLGGLAMRYAIFLCEEKGT
jgi:formate-dependent nitrite reductase membrane component NrfD